MAFNSLSDRLQMSLRRITGKGRLTEKDIEEMMREVRLSLLEADVNFKVVKSFTNSVKEQAMGEKILKGLNPGQQVVKIVNDELTKIMGGSNIPLTLNMVGITKMMMVGLQGAGKTTTAGKLALHLRKKNNLKPLLVALDIYRPAAVEQLKTVGGSLQVDVFEMGTIEKPLVIMKKAMEFASQNGNNLVIVDTAGRLQIDDDMMNELVEIKEYLKPDEVLLTVDAMTGQDAVNVAEGFHNTLGVTGAILTKLDGDTRGGAALSLREVTNIPIKLMGMGEKLDDLEVFHPERIASRILGMGDVMTLVDKVTENIDEDDMMGMMEKMMSGKFNYNDYLKQLKMVKKMGSLGGLMNMIPGMSKMTKGVDVDEKQLVYVEAMISSMTKEERKNPKLISGSSSRRRRVASGSGRKVSDVNRLIQTLEQTTSAMKRMSQMDPSKMNTSDPMSMLRNQPVKKKKGKGKNKKRFRY
jgi:signal recognition particle subunit SRP54